MILDPRTPLALLIAALLAPRDGRVYVRCWASTAAAAVALVIETIGR